MRLGELIGSPPTDFFIQWPLCTTWIDCGDLGELLARGQLQSDKNTFPLPGNGVQ
jgi:hypothetical protein